MMVSVNNTKLLIYMPNASAKNISKFTKEFYFNHLDLKLAKERSLQKEETISFNQLKILSNITIQTRI
jgi:hypothetical protein